MVKTFMMDVDREAGDVEDSLSGTSNRNLNGTVLIGSSILLVCLILFFSSFKLGSRSSQVKELELGETQEKIAYLESLTMGGESISILVAAMANDEIEIGFYAYEKLVSFQNAWIVESDATRLQNHQELLECLLELPLEATSVQGKWAFDLLRQSSEDSVVADLVNASPLRTRLDQAISILANPGGEDAVRMRSIGAGRSSRLEDVVVGAESIKSNQGVPDQLVTSDTHNASSSGASNLGTGVRVASFVQAAEPIPGFANSETAGYPRQDSLRAIESTGFKAAGSLKQDAWGKGLADAEDPSIKRSGLQALPFGVEASLQQVPDSVELTTRWEEGRRRDDMLDHRGQKSSGLTDRTNANASDGAEDIDEQQSALANHDTWSVVQWLVSDHRGFREIASEELTRRGYTSSEIGLARRYMREDLEYRLKFVGWVAESSQADPEMWAPLFFRSASRDFKLAAGLVLCRSRRQSVQVWIRKHVEIETDELVAAKLAQQLE